jgi:hypothetical protein
MRFKTSPTNPKPMPASGTMPAVLIDIAFQPKGAFGGAGPGALQVWASATSCGKDQLVWTSPSASAQWQTRCVTFTPSQNFGYIQLAPAHRGAGTTGVFVDHIVPVSSCAAAPHP